MGNVSLQSRLQGLPPQTTLQPEVAQKIAAEFQVPVAEVQSAFAAQQQALQRGIGSNEQAGRSSEALRASSTGGPFQGQAAANPTSTPALKGSNFVLPGDHARRFTPYAEALEQVARAAAGGRGQGPAFELELKTALAKVPTDDAATSELWSRAGDKPRDRLMKAMDALAAAAPDAVVFAAPDGRQLTARYSSLQTHMNDAVLRGDVADQKQWATEFLAHFPADPLAAFARGLSGA